MFFRVCENSVPHTARGTRNSDVDGGFSCFWCVRTKGHAYHQEWVWRHRCEHDKLSSWTIFHCIPSCSLNFRQMTSKTYHSVARKVAYKVIPSLLMSRPPRRNHTSNRLPLLPPIFLWGNTQPFEKGQNWDFFLFFWPNFGPFVEISVPDNFWENLQISRTIWRMNLSKVGMTDTKHTHVRKVHPDLRKVHSSNCSRNLQIFSKIVCPP